MDARQASGRIREQVGEALWAIALICLPVTTFPLFASLTGALVAPLSILPFAVLLILWGLPFLLRKGSLPRESLPLIAFILAAILSCAAAYFLFIPGFKGKTVPGQEIRALLTLAIGIIFFLVTVTWVRSTPRLNRTWKYLTIGGMLSLTWAGIQAIYILSRADQYPAWLEQIQTWFTVLSPSYSPRLGRVSGMTYEASWFAHQMVLVYLPIWLAATYHKTSAFKARILRLSVENILLILGLVLFFLSSPRIGLVSFLLLIIYLFYQLNVILHRRLVDRLSSWKFFSKTSDPLAHGTSRSLLASLLILGLYLVLFGGALTFAILRDWRLSLLVSDPPTVKEIVGLVTLNESTLLDFSHRFIFLERMVYWINGWNVFNQHPWLGVGLGNAGFFFPRLAPAIGWASFEIRNVLFYLPQLPNVKSFWFRLLAETGLVGFSIFITWLYILFRSAALTHRQADPTLKTFAFAGQLALLAFIGEGLSIDSFAFPYLWVMAGLIASIGMILRQSKAKATAAQ